MDDNVIHIPQEDIEIIDASEYSEDLTEYFNDMPEVARPLVKGAKEAFSKIEQMLYSAPAFINLVKASVPEQTFQAMTSVSKSGDTKICRFCLRTGNIR